MTSRRYAVGLRIAGLCLCAFSAWAFTGLHLAAAAPEPVRAVLQLPLIIAPVAVAPPESALPADGTPEPEPSFTATPAPRLVTRRGGPLEFSLSGSVNVGNRTSQTDRDASLGIASDSQTQTTGNVGMLAEVTRRTASTTLQFGIPFDVASTNSSTLGLAQISYATPHYEISYQASTPSAFGQLPIGSTLRGFALTLPFGSGDAQLFEGPAIGSNGDVVPVQGVRLRRQVGRSLAEFAATQNPAGFQTAAARTELVGLASSLGRLTFVGEAALQQKPGTGTGSAFAYQGRVDAGSFDSGWSATLRHVPERFLLYGTGEAYGDSYLDVSFRRFFKGQLASAEIGYDTTSLSGISSSQRRTSFSYGGQVGRVQYQLGLQEQKLFGGSSPSQWSGQTGLQLATSSSQGMMLLGVQAGRMTQPIGGNIGTAALSAQIDRNVGQMQIGVAYQAQRQTNPTTGASLSGVENFSISRLFGRSAVGVAYGVNHAITPYSDAVTRSPVLQLGRQISPALSLQVQYGRQSLVDAVNPALNSRGRLFSVQINAPFALGSGAVQGRADARLPATISGRVLADTGMNNTFGFLTSGGMGDVVVVLDNRDVQRTDLEGSFRFSFVSPGPHTIRIENASLPRGYTVDQPVATLNLEGGQTGQVVFRVGNFGAIAGHVFGRDSGGSLIPLSDVMLRLDGGMYSKTDANGAYGFGRLLAGDHVVQIVTQSIPAFADFPADAVRRTVSVQNGNVATVDFTAQQLGSIAGRLLFLQELKPDFNGGVNNAYVVAEPGEHAAITDPDGSFVLDDLPAGTYNVSVDPQTLPDPTGPVEDGAAVTLAGGEHYEGLLFHIGRKKKTVVFTFIQQKTAGVEIGLGDSRLPPLGSTNVHVSAPKDAGEVSAFAFGKTTALRYDESGRYWSGTIAVPAGAKAGAQDVVAHWGGKAPGTAASSLQIDPQMPLALLQTIPAHAAIGQYVAVRARFLADVRSGDTIEWQDGTVTTLRKPASGRIFSFSLHLSLRPLHGTLLTRSGKLPIMLP